MEHLRGRLDGLGGQSRADEASVLPQACAVLRLLRAADSEDGHLAVLGRGRDPLLELWKLEPLVLERRAGEHQRQPCVVE